MRRRSSGESSGPSNFGEGFRQGDHIAKPGSAAAAARPGPNVVGRSMSGRRITRPATLDDSGPFLKPVVLCHLRFDEPQQRF